MNADEVLRAQLLTLLQGRGAHMTFDEAVADFPPEHINTRPPGMPYTMWHLLEHLRIAQRDILDFVREPGYEEPRWPDDYWPPRDATADQTAWERTIAAFREDLAAVQALVSDPGNDLAAPLPYDRGYSLLREVLLVADHNAYHVGEFAILRQVLGAWPAGH